MADNTILVKNLPGGALQKEVESFEAGIVPGKVLQIDWNATPEQFEGQLNEVARPGLRIVRGGFDEGLDMTYADGDWMRYYVAQSGEEYQVWIYGEADAAASAVAVGDILYKTAVGDHTTAHEGMLDVNATDGIAVARAKEAVTTDTAELIRLEVL